MVQGRGRWWKRAAHAAFPAVTPRSWGRKRRKRKPPSEFKRRQRAERVRERAQQRQADTGQRRAERVRERQQADRYGQIWMEERLSRPNARSGYSKHLEFFNDIPGMMDIPEADRQEIWRIYLDSMVGGHQRRNSPMNPFWQATGIHPTSGRFDWQTWRETMGYKSRRAA